MKECPHCTHVNESFFKFCLKCGGDLSRAPAAQELKPAAAPKPKKPDPVAAAPQPAVAALAQDTVEVPAAETAPVESNWWGEGSSPDWAADQRPGASTTGEFETAADPLENLPAGEEDDGQRCPGCGGVLDHSTKFCGLCGYRFPEPEPELVAEPGERNHSRIRLVLINEDGSDGRSFEMFEGVNSLGRDGNDMFFDDDVYLSPHHANMTVDGDMVTVEDNESLNGSYIRITEPALLQHGDTFRLGQELLRYEDLDKSPADYPIPSDGTELLGGPVSEGVWGRLVQLMSPDLIGNSYLLSGRFVTLGRERGDITFPGDGYVSGRHATLTRRNGALYLEDLDSSNGTYVRIKGSAAVFDGDLLLMGQQLFRVSF